MAKKTKKKPVKTPSRSKPAPPPVAAPAPQPAPIAAPSATPPPTKPRPAARHRRALLSPAGRRGADLVRFLRLHGKKPYGSRGERAIHKLALEVAHLGRIELGDSAPVAEN